MSGPIIDLATLGWNPHWTEAFASFAALGYFPGRVSGEEKHYYRVVTANGEFLATLAGRMFHQRASNAGLPKVGDWVAISAQTSGDRRVIHGVLPRQSRLARKVPGRETEEQILVANADVAFIVQALDDTFNLRRIERFLVIAREGGVAPVVVLNKADLGEVAKARITEARTALGMTPTLVTSARTRLGLGELRSWLKPTVTAVFVGVSGVGKSSLINRLFGEAIQTTIEVRDHDHKGRHATTWRELILLPNGALVIDTPGMREIHLWDITENLEEAFPEIMELALACHFRDCQHRTESRCAVRAAVEAGQLLRSRYESFLKLRNERNQLAELRQGREWVDRRRRGRMSERNHPH